MKTLFGYAFDGWNGMRAAFRYWGEAIDRAMDAWGSDE